MPYIIVGKIRGASPHPHPHETKASARGEAQRLALAYPDDEFTIYASVATFRQRRVEEVDATPPDLDEVPF